MSRNIILWLAPCVGLMGCQSLDDEAIDVEDVAIEPPEDEDEAPGEGAPDAFEIADHAVEAPPPNPDALLVAPVARWSYFPQSACVTTYPKDPMGNFWYETDYTPTGWVQPATTAELGYGDGDEHTVIPFGPSETQKCITQFFRYTFTVEDPTLYGSLVLQLLRDDGAAVYLNGKLIKRDNLPQTFGLNTVASSTVEDSDEDRFFVTTGIANNLTKVAPFVNVLAVEVHQRSKSNPDLSFNLALLGRLNPDASYVTRSFRSADATIAEQSADTPLGDGNECKVDGASGDNNTDGDQVCLSKWNLSDMPPDHPGLPPGATVVAAHLDTHVNNGSPDRYEVYSVKTNWEEFTSTWNDSDTKTSLDWTTSGHFGMNDLVVDPTSPLTVVNSIGEGRRIYALPPKVVQTWANATTPGIAFFNTKNVNGIDFDASGAGLELVITYKPPTTP